MLVLNGVCKMRRLAGGDRLEVLKGLAFRARAGRPACLLGPSGCGKSTILRLINRLEDPDAGTILVGGRDVREVPVLQLRRQVGLVLQKPFLFAGTVYENAVAAHRYAGRTLPDHDDPALARLMDLVRLGDGLLKRRSTELSVGQQQRVAIVRALLPGPRLLLMDEPTAALDVRTADELMGMLGDLIEETGPTVLAATHDLAAARRMGGLVLFVDGGRVVEEGAAADLLDHPRSAELRNFLMMAEDDGAAGGA